MSGTDTEWKPWLDEYYGLFKPAFDPSIYPALVGFRDIALGVRAAGGKMMFAGNGASASISSHGAVDFTKQGQVRSMDFNEPNLITCFANDFGYENWVQKAVEFYSDPNDALVLTSVSGTSKNIVNAAQFARDKGLKIVTFSGKKPDNPLRQLGDVNFYLESEAYNVVEAVHMLWMTTVVDMLVGKAAYSVV